ncbi:MAG: hypothetical protein R2769_10975 [Saprospiraceae bacterium]
MNLERLIHKGQEFDYDAIVIADHGNSDYMINADNTPNTAHTMNPVPIFYISKNPSFENIKMENWQTRETYSSKTNGTYSTSRNDW